jgi:hypothetical protein
VFRSGDVRAGSTAVVCAVGAPEIVMHAPRLKARALVLKILMAF